MSSSDQSQTRRELLETIDAQKDKLAKYETRLRDVVRAYKGLAKEKEALEATLKAVSATGPEDGRQEEADGPDEGGQGRQQQEAASEEGSERANTNDDASSTASGSDAGGASGNRRPSAAVRGSSEAKVRTLAASIATLTAEKSRLEADFQEDRRKILHEKKERERQADELQKELSAFKSKARQELEEAKSKLIIEKHEREKELSNHALTIRELQKLVSEERRAKEKAEQGRHEAEDRARKAAASEGATSEEQDRRIRVLEGKFKLRLEEAEKAAKQAREGRSAAVEEGKGALEEARASHRRDVDRAERRAEEAEGRMSAVRVEQEKRVNALEARLQELSETVGTYDRLRQHDQAELDKMRDRVQQLTQENAALSEAGGARRRLSSESGANYDDLDVQALLDKFYRLKTAVKEANRTAANPVADLDSLLSDGDDDKWKDKFERVSAELEAHKRAAATMQKSSASSSSSSSAARAGLRYLLPEVDQEVVLSLRTQISELQDKVAVLRSQTLEKDAANVRLVEREKELQASLSSLRHSSKEQVDSLETEYRSKVVGLETELQKQRDRCLTLIEEKEDEVNMLKANMEMAFEKTFAAAATAGSATGAAGSKTVSPEGGDGVNSREMQLRMAAASTIANTAGGSVSGRKSRNNSHQDSTVASVTSADITDRLKSSSPNEGMVLHYVQELSLKEVEIGNLRRQVFDVEAAMRELQMSAVAKEERYVDQIDLLSDEVARLKRMRMGSASGEDAGANMEYLKNVVLSYMLSSDAASRDHMLKAIGAVLLFRSEEVKQVRDFNLSWWWSHGQGGAGGGGQVKKGHR